MKKVIAFLLAMVMVFSLSACDSDAPATVDDSIDVVYRCMQCGEEMPSSDKFCGSCGAVLNPSNDSSYGDDAPSGNIDNSTSSTQNTSSHSHTFIVTEATCEEPTGKCDCGEVLGYPLGHDYINGYCTRCNKKDPNYTTEPEPVEIQKIGLNTKVTVSSTYKDRPEKNIRRGEMEITVVGFEKTDWKSIDPDDPEYSSLGTTEEIGMLLLKIKRTTYVAYDNDPDYVDFSDFVRVYDKDEAKLNAVSRGYSWGSYTVAMLEDEDNIKQNEVVKIAIPYIYDTSNSTLTVILGDRYQVEVPVTQ